MFFVYLVLFLQNSLKGLHFISFSLSQGFFFFFFGFGHFICSTLPSCGHTKNIHYSEKKTKNDFNGILERLQEDDVMVFIYLFICISG